jgi:hypothetical protein
MYIMILVTLILFLLIWVVIGIWVALPASVLFHLGWMYFNYRASTIGLIKANLFAYFSALSQGSTEDEALAWVVQTRYPNSEEKRSELLAILNHYHVDDSAEERIKSLVLSIYSSENGVPPDIEFEHKLNRNIDRIYSSMLIDNNKKKAQLLSEVEQRMENVSALVNRFLKAIEDIYSSLKQRNPGKDEHWYLAQTWLQRYKSSSSADNKYLVLPSVLLAEARRNGPQVMQKFAYIETHQFAILESPKAARALALYLLYKEMPEQAESFSSEFAELMKPIHLSEDNHTFFSLYKEKNKVTYQSIMEQSGVEDDLKAFLLSMELKDENPELVHRLQRAIDEQKKRNL